MISRKTGDAKTRLNLLLCVILALCPGPNNATSFNEQGKPGEYFSRPPSRPEGLRTKADEATPIAPATNINPPAPVPGEEVIRGAQSPRNPPAESRRGLTEVTVSPSLEPTCSWVCAEAPTSAPTVACPCLDDSMFPKWHILATDSVAQSSASVSGAVSACGSSNTTSSFDQYTVGAGLSSVETNLITLRVLGKLEVSSTTVYEGQTHYGTIVLGDDVTFQGGAATVAATSDAVACSTDIAIAQDTAKFLLRSATARSDGTGCTVRLLNTSTGSIVLDASDAPTGSGGFTTFCIAASDLTHSTEVELHIDAASFVVVVVTGDDLADITISKLAFKSDASLAVAAARVIWVFGGTGDLRLNLVKTNWLGTILAPEADMIIESSVLNGRAYVKSLVGPTPHRVSNDALVLPNCTCEF